MLSNEVLIVAVNFTPITEMLTAVVGIMPALADFVVGVMPIIFIMIIISFIAYFFDAIVGMIRGLV
jgi:hypothetical protein